MRTLAVGLVLLIADQWSKEWVRGAFGLHDVRPVIGEFFLLTYVRNTGAAWGLFRGANHWLALLSAAVLVLMVAFRRSFLRATPAHRLSLGLLCGGVAGNLIDRVRLGYVVDFLSFHFGRYEFPAFNLADAAITTGVAIYVATSLWDEVRARAAAARPAAPAS